MPETAATVRIRNAQSEIRNKRIGVYWIFFSSP